jgi:IclR family acetate operon transcriptional repressor
MKTVDKAMSLLGLFSTSQPEIGLSELSRLAALDKAATHRLLAALSKHGLVEQKNDNRKYRLGSAFLHFARIREHTVPIAAIVQPIILELSRTMGETAHVSMLSGQHLSTIAVSEPNRATRASVDPREPLPLYATASGFACLAFSQETFREDYIANLKLKRVTRKTVASKAKLRSILQQTQVQGFGRAEHSFEDEVIGTAAPIFDQHGCAIGAVAVAAVASRFNEQIAIQISNAVMSAADTITKGTGGHKPKGSNDA